MRRAVRRATVFRRSFRTAGIFCFATLPPKNQKFDIFVGATDGTRSDSLTSAESAAVYAEPGYVIFARKNVLVAQLFDAGSGTSGEAVAIGDAPSATGAQYSAGRAVSVSTPGTIAYLGDRLPDTRLVWFDRSGRETGTLAVPEGRYQEIAFAPDGRRAAIVRFGTQSETDIWIADAERGGANRFTSTPGLNIDVLWSPERRPHPVFQRSQRARATSSSSPRTARHPRNSSTDRSALQGFARLVAGRQVDGLRTARSADQSRPVDPAHGGRLFDSDDHTHSLMATPKPYLRTAFNEQAAVISPDGKWIAYVRTNPVDSKSTSTRSRRRTTSSRSPTAAPSGRSGKDGRELAIMSADGRSVLVSGLAPARSFMRPFHVCFSRCRRARCTPGRRRTCSVCSCRWRSMRTSRPRSRSSSTGWAR